MEGRIQPSCSLAEITVLFSRVLNAQDWNWPKRSLQTVLAT